MTAELRFLPCASFEARVHAYVDDELTKPESENLLVHLELCDSCRQSVEALRRQIRIHRESLDIARMVEGFDRASFFKTLNGALLTGNLDRLAELLYELGKAYFVAANDARLPLFLHKKAVAIERARGEGRRLVRETAAVALKAERVERKAAEAVRRSERLFRQPGSEVRKPRIGFRSGRGSLDNARRFLEEALILRPLHARARLYLGVYFLRVDRPAEAIAEYHKILAQKDLETGLKVMALQALGNAHAYRRDYKKAIRCFEEIVGTGAVEEDARFFTIYLSLGMFQAKVARYERSAEWFGRLLERFPSKIKEARDVLAKADVFRGLLAANEGFRNRLLERYPVLFSG